MDEAYKFYSLYYEHNVGAEENGIYMEVLKMKKVVFVKDLVLIETGSDCCKTSAFSISENVKLVSIQKKYLQNLLALAYSCCNSEEVSSVPNGVGFEYVEELPAKQELIAMLEHKEFDTWFGTDARKISQELIASYPPKKYLKTYVNSMKKLSDVLLKKYPIKIKNIKDNI